MRQLINSLQSHNRQLKAEVNRYKKKVKPWHFLEVLILNMKFSRNFTFNYLKVRDYQADSERQKQLNDIKKKNEEDVLAHLNDLENNLLITGNF